MMINIAAYADRLWIGMSNQGSMLGKRALISKRPRMQAKRGMIGERALMRGTPKSASEARCDWRRSAAAARSYAREYQEHKRSAVRLGAVRRNRRNWENTQSL